MCGWGGVCRRVGVGRVAGGGCVEFGLFDGVGGVGYTLFDEGRATGVYVVPIDSDIR